MAKKKVVQEEELVLDVTPIVIEDITEENKEFNIGDILGRNVIIDGKQDRQYGILDIFRQLRNIPDTNDGGKFAYFTMKNTDRLSSIYNTITKKHSNIFTSKFSQEMHESFNKEKELLRNELQELEMNLTYDHALKDENDQPRLEGNKPVIEDEEKFFEILKAESEKVIKERMDKYQPLIDETNNRNKMYEQMLDIKIDKLDLHTIKREYLPKGITGYQYEMIKFWIVD